jgi:hypothetical protein
MFQSDLLGLSTKRCPRNMVGQHSRVLDSLIACHIVRQTCISPSFWSSDCGVVFATRHQRPPREARGNVRRPAHVANPRNVRYTRSFVYHPSCIPDTFEIQTGVGLAYPNLQGGRVLARGPKTTGSQPWSWRHNGISEDDGGQHTPVPWSTP